MAGPEHLHREQTSATRAGRVAASRRIVAVNHKMYFGYAQTMAWCSRLAEIAASHPATVSGAVEIVVLPCAPALAAAIASLRPFGVKVGAQNMHSSASGAYTGEVGAAILAEMGCNVVTIGHAERRTLFHESDGDVARKVVVAFEHGLTPLVCVGEQQRIGSDEAIGLCMVQLERAFSEVANRSGRLIVAYEPLWAIGASEPAAPVHVHDVCRELSRRIRHDLGFERASLIYGGAAGPGQWPTFGAAVDGLFLGRRAHDPSRVGAVLNEMWSENNQEGTR